MSQFENYDFSTVFSMELTRRNRERIAIIRKTVVLSNNFKKRFKSQPEVASTTQGNIRVVRTGKHRDPDNYVAQRQLLHVRWSRVWVIGRFSRVAGFNGRY